MLTFRALRQWGLPPRQVEGAVIGVGHLSIRVLRVGQREFFCDNSIIKLKETGQ